MLSICAIKSEPDAKIIESITRENEPAGTIKIIRNQKEAINTIIDTDPDIVYSTSLNPSSSFSFLDLARYLRYTFSRGFEKTVHTTDAAMLL